MNSKNKCRKKVNTNVAGKIRSWTRRFEAFKKLMVSLMTITDDFVIKLVSLGFNIYQWHF